MLVVVLDGVRVEEFTSDWTSDLTGVSGEDNAQRTWSEVVPHGTVVRSILNPVLTSTAPGHAALVSGRAEPLLNVGFGHQGPALYRPLLPTIFEEARSQKGWSADDAVLMANSVVMSGVNASIYPGLEDFGGTWSMVTEPMKTAVEDDDTRTFALLEDLLASDAPQLLVVNFHDADRAAHLGPEGGYLDRVAEQDAQFALLWEWLNQGGHEAYLDGLLVVLTADHGRHRHALEDGWVNHGDACDGCREVPLLLLGAGVEAGRVEAGTWSLLDVAPTIAAHLGIDLPWAQGMPLSSLVDTGTALARRGEVDVELSGAHLATRRWRDDAESRSEVVVDGVVVSTPGIFAAEAPAVLDGAEASYVCFREFSSVAAEGWMPWIPRCLIDDGAGWRELGFPESTVGPFWKPVLTERDGVLWAAWLHTPLVRGEDGLDGVRVASWSPTQGWASPTGPTTPATTLDVDLVPTPDGLLLSASVNLADPEEAYTRRAAVWGFDGTGQRTRVDTQFQFETLLGDPRRVERPALRANGDRVQLAAMAMDEGRRFVAYVESRDSGATWSEPLALPSEGSAFLHLPPRWDGEEVVWGTLLPDGTSGICTVRPGAAAASCRSTGSPRLDSFDVEHGVVVASVDVGAGDWRIVTSELPK